MLKTIAVIPARGGSRRIPRKNIHFFLGRPMIEWSIKAAIDSSLFDIVLVSTDNDEIAEISRQAGADVPFLRRAHYDDLTPVSAATVHALQQAEEHYGRKRRTADGELSSAKRKRYQRSLETLPIRGSQLSNKRICLRLDESVVGSPSQRLRQARLVISECAPPPIAGPR